MKDTKCNVCGSNYYEVVYKLKGAIDQKAAVEYRITEDKADLSSLRIVRCLRCGLVYVNPQEDINTIYQKYCNLKDDVYVSEENGRRLAARIILKKIARLARRGKILDIGCATGFLLDEARKMGFDAYGVEISRWAAQFCRQQFNLNIFEGLLKEAEFPYNFFDAVVMVDSIEHLTNPKRTLEEIRRILKPGGILVISTPDMDSF